MSNLQEQGTRLGGEMSQVGSVTPNGPGVGPGWERLAAALRSALSAGEIDRAWAFRIVRRAGQDFGTAILSQVDGDRRRIHTASFVHTVKGKQRGKFDWSLHELGSGPFDTLDELLALVPKRSDEEEPPAPVDPSVWFRAPHPDDAALDPG